jgi:hypothetical protein
MRLMMRNLKFSIKVMIILRVTEYRVGLKVIYTSIKDYLLTNEVHDHGTFVNTT